MSSTAPAPAASAVQAAVRPSRTGPVRLPGHVALDGVRHLVLDRGPLEAPTTLVLVHGLGLNAAVWSAHLPTLTATHRVLALDVRGHGGSELGPEPVTIARVVADLAVLADAARITGRAVVVGHSMGGTIATAAALAGGWDALVVIDPAYGADEAEMPGVHAKVEALRRDGAASLGNLPQAFTAAVDPSLLVPIEHALLVAAPQAVADLVESSYLAHDAMAPEAAARAWLAGRGLPTLALYPDQYRARTDRAVGGADVEVWQGSSHFLHQEDPERFCTRVLSWLEAIS